jgi:hypothetical protein
LQVREKPGGAERPVLENAKLVQEAGTIACPILVFVSDGKRVSSGWLEHVQAFAEQTKAKVIHLNCGHYIHYYESERISREIRAFVFTLFGEASQYEFAGA